MSEYHNTTSSPSPTLSFRSTPSPEHPEDQPLGGAGRTFAQLLVDQLGEAEDKDASLTQPKKVYFMIKPFLRRGTGLTRFNLPPDPTQQPSQRKRSQSQPRLSDVQSRLNQETQSFANKKTKPKRSLSRSPTMHKRKPQVNPVSPAKMKSPKKSALATKVNQFSGPHQPVPELTSGKDSIEDTLKDKLKIKEAVNEKDLKELALFEMLNDTTTGYRNLYSLNIQV